MNQMSIREGIRRFGERVNDALLEELNQLDEREALLLLRKEDLSQEQTKKAL